MENAVLFVFLLGIFLFTVAVSVTAFLNSIYMVSMALKQERGDLDGLYITRTDEILSLENRGFGDIYRLRVVCMSLNRPDWFILEGNYEGIISPSLPALPPNRRIEYNLLDYFTAEEINDGLIRCVAASKDAIEGFAP